MVLNRRIFASARSITHRRTRDNTIHSDSHSRTTTATTTNNNTNDTMTMQTFWVFVHTENAYREIPSGADNCSETICRELCKMLKIQPIVNLLFALRIESTDNFLAGCNELKADVKYQFRLRHQIPNLDELLKMDKAAFNYFFHQVKYDLVRENSIRELEYPNHSDHVAGLAYASMLNEILEGKATVDQFSRSNKLYRQHVPSKLITHHSFKLRNRLIDKLRETIQTSRDPAHVKRSYLDQIRKLAPSHFTEKYSGLLISADDQICDSSRPELIELEITPFDEKQPGIRFIAVNQLNHAADSENTKWRHIGKIDDIYSIYMDGNVVKIELSDSPVGFSIEIADTLERLSFVGGLAVYYRLMAKWTVNLCRELSSESLKMLEKNRCHGPIGGEFAYRKLQQQSRVGAYIIRQCEKIHENYYIDIIIERDHIRTFKITALHESWRLHSQEGVCRAFSSLTELAMSIDTPGHRKCWLEPSAYDSSPTLLLCRSTSHLAKKIITEHSENVMRENQSLIFHPARDFRIYLHSKKYMENGTITQMRADWILPENKRLEVTLKELNNPNLHVEEFMRLGNEWSSLSSPELIKMYGFSFAPYTLVFESIKLGPLNEFLRNSIQPIPVVNLINISLTLARALHYLHEKNKVHGRIRCESLFVVKYKPPNVVVRLGDPGLRKSFNLYDKPWIPFEHHNSLERPKMDFKADMWAYATTLWEIFSYGRTPMFEEFSRAPEFRRPHRPVNCPDSIYKIMKQGWNDKSEGQLSPQTLISELIKIREEHLSEHSPRPAPDPDTLSNGSMASVITQTTSPSGIYHPTSIGVFGSPESPTSSICSDTTLNDNTPLIIRNPEPVHTHKSDYSESVVELEDNSNLIYKGEIGEGNYGSVYRGSIEYIDGHCVEVAIKRLKQLPDKEALKDFKREIEIMRGLEHPNIVKIITSTTIPEILIVMEYVRHRSFLVYLRSHSPLLNTCNLLRFAKDIASGMAYLVTKKIVHRDLAARNILVDSMECVKISDFGLAQKTDSNGYYVFHNSRQIPIKWYAPETLRENKYSHFSDVWSYGITLFEMFSRGQQPDLVPGKELQLFDLLQRLESGERLKQPHLCPMSIYESLLLPCWRDIPRNRPSFTELLEIIDEQISEHSDNILDHLPM